MAIILNDGSDWTQPILVIKRRSWFPYRTIRVYRMDYVGDGEPTRSSKYRFVMGYDDRYFQCTKSELVEFAETYCKKFDRGARISKFEMTGYNYTEFVIPSPRWYHEKMREILGIFTLPPAEIQQLGPYR